jgi:NAD(P)-dependent dehydrogenase (short-subunit alcohol dehydrogenase family)
MAVGENRRVAAAIVTGGNTGIGRAVSVALARGGFDVGVAWHRDEERAASVVHEVEDAGRRCELRRLDLHDAPDGARAVDELAETLGGLDVLVNNAGGGIYKPLLDVTLDDWQSVIAVNLTGAFVVAQAAARRMAASGGGSIVNVTSVHEHIPLRGNGPYTAAKHGLGGLTKAMALELAEHGIRVNSVAPGQIATAMSGQEDQEPRRIPVPLGRAGDAREVAALVAWLASDAASYVTGASYLIDGGLSLVAGDHQ